MAFVMKNKDTVLFLGVWEQLNNSGFNSPEFEGVKNEAGQMLPASSACMPRQAGTGANRVLSNLECINALSIHQGLGTKDRLVRLNAIAITQMQSLIGLNALQQLASPVGHKQINKGFPK